MTYMRVASGRGADVRGASGRMADVRAAHLRMAARVAHVLVADGGRLPCRPRG